MSSPRPALVSVLMADTALFTAFNIHAAESEAKPAALTVAVALKDRGRLPLFTDSVKAPFLINSDPPTNRADRVSAKGGENIGSIRTGKAQVNSPDDSLKVTRHGTDQLYIRLKPAIVLGNYLDEASALVFDAMVHEPAQDSVSILVNCRYSPVGAIEGKRISTACQAARNQSSRSRCRALPRPTRDFWL